MSIVKKAVIGKGNCQNEQLFLRLFISHNLSLFYLQDRMCEFIRFEDNFFMHLKSNKLKNGVVDLKGLRN